MEPLITKPHTFLKDGEIEEKFFKFMERMEQIRAEKEKEKEQEKEKEKEDEKAQNDK